MAPMGQPPLGDGVMRASWRSAPQPGRRPAARPDKASSKAVRRAGIQLSRSSARAVHLPAHCQWRRSSRSEEHTSELQSQSNLVCRLLLEKKKLKSSMLNLSERMLGTDIKDVRADPRLRLSTALQLGDQRSALSVGNAERSQNTHG